MTIVNAVNPHTGYPVHKGTVNYLRTGPSRHDTIILKMAQDTTFQIVAFASGGSAEDGYYKALLQAGTTDWTAKVNVKFTSK